MRTKNVNTATSESAELLKKNSFSAIVSEMTISVLILSRRFFYPFG